MKLALLILFILALLGLRELLRALSTPETLPNVEIPDWLEEGPWA